MRNTLKLAFVLFVLVLVIKYMYAKQEEYSIMLGDESNRLIINQADLIAIINGILPEYIYKKDKFKVEDIPMIIRTVKQKLSTASKEHAPNVEILADIRRLFNDKKSTYRNRDIQNKDQFIKNVVDFAEQVIMKRVKEKDERRNRRMEQQNTTSDKTSVKVKSLNEPAM